MAGSIRGQRARAEPVALDVHLEGLRLRREGDRSHDREPIEDPLAREGSREPCRSAARPMTSLRSSAPAVVRVRMAAGAVPQRDRRIRGEESLERHGDCPGDGDG